MRELPLCAAAQEKSRGRHSRRSRQDLKLLWNDWLGARIAACALRYSILELRHALKERVLFDIA